MDERGSEIFPFSSVTGKREIGIESARMHLCV
jgi:hypothetical protein